VARPGDLPTAILRVEGAVILSLALFLYVRGEGGWLFLVVLLLAPDVGMLGYVAGFAARSDHLERFTPRSVSRRWP
jgi:hypothetical protein